jgi:hypothetical protein
MTYRKFDTCTWHDTWFEELDSNSKLAFIYLWTNETCNPAGIYKISPKRVNFELGYDIDTVSTQLSDKVVWYPDRKIIWVKNFFRRQCQNYKFVLAALNSIKDDPFMLNVFIEYNKELILSFKDKSGSPIIDISKYQQHTISQPYPTEQNRTEQKQNRNNNPQLSVKKHDTAKQTNVTPPAGISFKDLKSKKVTYGPKSKNNGKRLNEYFQGINQACDKITTLPKKQKQFDPFKWAQQQIGKSKHPGAIMESLEGLIMFWASANDPWAYALNILSKKNGTFNEQDAISYHKELKNIEPGQLEFITHGLLKEMPE